MSLYGSGAYACLPLSALVLLLFLTYRNVKKLNEIGFCIVYEYQRYLYITGVFMVYLLQTKSINANENHCNLTLIKSPQLRILFVLKQKSSKRLI